MVSVTREKNKLGVTLRTLDATCRLDIFGERQAPSQVCPPLALWGWRTLCKGHNCASVVSAAWCSGRSTPTRFRRNLISEKKENNGDFLKLCCILQQRVQHFRGRDVLDQLHRSASARAWRHRRLHRDQRQLLAAASARGAAYSADAVTGKAAAAAAGPRQAPLDGCRPPAFNPPDWLGLFL